MSKESPKCNEVFCHTNQWWWGVSVDIIKTNGTAMVCVKFDEKSHITVDASEAMRFGSEPLAKIERANGK